MTIELLVPALGESVVEATVAKWMKSSGDTINADEPIVELETEKVTLEVPSPISGVLKEIVANEGDNVEVGALLGIISDSLNDVQPPNNSNQEKKLEENSSNTHTSTEKKNSHLSPAVKRIVTENDLNPAEIIPSGKDGLITKGDALNKLSNQDLPTQLQSHDNRDPQEERVPMSRLRKVVAKRLKEAQNTAAMLTTFNEVDMSSVMSLRSEYKDDFEKEHKIRLGFMGMFVLSLIHI